MIIIYATIEPGVQLYSINSNSDPDDLCHEFDCIGCRSCVSNPIFHPF